jgi:hypothetical protein
MTNWINKNKFMENFSGSIETFSDISFNVNPLTMFLQSNPLKSIYDRDITNSRNTQEPFTTPDDKVDNIKDFGTPEDVEEIGIKDPEEQKEPKTSKKKQPLLSERDANLIRSIIIALLTLFLTVYVSYNWFFNLTEGKRQVKFYESFDFVNFAYFFTEYFYKIIKFFDMKIMETTPNFVANMLESSFFKERSLFVFILLISKIIVQKSMAFIFKIYYFLKKFLIKRKIDIGLFYDPKNNNAIFSMLFFYFVVEGIISSFTSGIVSNAIDPSSTFKESMTSFKIAHPIVYIIILVIRLAIVHTPTISAVSSLFFLYIGFYSVFSILYYIYINPVIPLKDSLYVDVKSGSLVDFYRRIHAIINLKHILFEIKSDTPWYKTWAEKILRTFFIYLPFIILFSGLLKVLPIILKINSPNIKMIATGIFGLLVLWIMNFAINEDYRLQIVKDKIREQMADASNIVKTVFTELFKEEPSEEKQMQEKQMQEQQMEQQQMEEKQTQEPQQTQEQQQTQEPQIDPNQIK